MRTSVRVRPRRAAIGRQAAERHADDGRRVGAPAARIAAATSSAMARGPSSRASRRQSECPWPGRSIATSGRPRASATVSHVWAFWAPPCSSTSSGGAVAPHQGAELDARRPPATDCRRTPAGPRGQPDSAALLLEQAELVVLGHRRSLVGRHATVGRGRSRDSHRRPGGFIRARRRRGGRPASAEIHPESAARRRPDRPPLATRHRSRSPRRIRMQLGMVGLGRMGANLVRRLVARRAHLRGLRRERRRRPRRWPPSTTPSPAPPPSTTSWPPSTRPRWPG